MDVRLIDATKLRRIFDVWLSEMNNNDYEDQQTGTAIYDCACQLDDAPTIDPETLPSVKELQDEIKTLKEMNSEYLCMMVDVFDILNAMYGSCGKFCDDCIHEFWDKWGDDSKKSGLSEEEKKKRNKFIRDVLNKKILFYDDGNKKEE